MHDLAAVCHLLRPLTQPVRWGQDEWQTSAFVKAMQSIPQRRFSRTIAGLSSRGFRVTKLSPPSPEAPQGVYRPLRVWSITIWPESKLAESRMTPFSNALAWLSHFRSLHVTAGPNRVEKPQSESRDRDPMRRAQARANGHATHWIRSEFGCWKLQESRPRCRLRAGCEPRTARQ
jgi:hypothetical protein